MKNDYLHTHYLQYIGNKDNYIENKAKRYRMQFSKELQKHNNFPNIKVLDIGCGIGDFCYFLHEIGCKYVTGIDSSKEAINFCQRNFPYYKFYQVDVHQYFNDYTERYDVVSMFSFLEHSKKDDVVCILSGAKDILESEGLLLLSTPNMDCLFSNTRGRYGDFTHEVGFTRSSLEQVLRESGFESIAVFGTKRPRNNVFEFVFYQMYQRTALRLLSVLFRSLSLGFPEIHDYVLWAIAK